MTHCHHTLNSKSHIVFLPKPRNVLTEHTNPNVPTDRNTIAKYLHQNNSMNINPWPNVLQDQNWFWSEELSPIFNQTNTNNGTLVGYFLRIQVPRTVTETMERESRASRGFSLEKQLWRTSSPMLENRGPVPSRCL